jgi:transposase
VGWYPTVTKENRLIKKVKRLIRRLGCPRWLHRFGPKTYEFYQHLCALLVRYFCQLSYRRIKQLFNLLDITCPSKSALQYTSAKIKSTFWQKALKATSGSPYLIAIDSTGFSRTNPSYHYLRRIDGKIPKCYVKASVAFDTRRKKYCAAKIRVLPAHDIRDVKYLLKKCEPKVLVADKAYDANWLHEYCKKENIRAYIPIRKWGKPRHKNMSARMKAAKNFKERIYHRRELVESGNSSIKGKYGSSVRSKKVRTIRTEIYGRLTCHNLFSYFQRLLGQSHNNLYILLISKHIHA